MCLVVLSAVVISKIFNKGGGGGSIYNVTNMVLPCIRVFNSHNL